jgi:hypothetical protein
MLLELRTNISDGTGIESEVVMKIRNGFVSNSSSSSYVIAFPKGDVCDKCGRGDGKDLSSGFSRETCGDSAPTLYGLGKMEVLRQLHDNGYDFECLVEYVEQVSAKAAEGYEVMYIAIPYGAEGMLDTITAAGGEVLIDMS